MSACWSASTCRRRRVRPPGTPTHSTPRTSPSPETTPSRSTPAPPPADDTDGNYVTATTSWYYLSGLDVVAPSAVGSVVAFGDSITDGFNTPTGAYRTWPEDLARRLAGSQPFGVVNAGIGG